MSVKWRLLGIGVASVFLTSIHNVWVQQFSKRLPLRTISHDALLSKLEGLKGNFKSRHVHTFTLSLDLSTKLSHSKTMTAALHCAKRQLKLELKVYNTMNIWHFVRPLHILR